MKRIALFTVFVAGAAVAQSEEGVYSAEGVQLRSDARLHALFAMLNERGFDRESARGPEPTNAPRYHEQRARLREKLKLSDDVQKQADAFLAAHPDNVLRYVRAALSLEDAPKFGVPEGGSLDGYEGLSKLLAGAWSAGAAEIYDDQLRDYRKSSKELLGRVDELTAQMRKTLHLDGSVDDLLAAEDDATERIIVLSNPLDAHGTQLRHQVGDVRYVVLGPWQKVADKGVLDPIVVELARSLIGPELRRLADQAPVAALHTQAGPAAAGFKNAQDYVLEALARATAKKVLGRPLFLKTGDTVEPELPVEPALVAPFDAFASGSDKLGAALPAMLALAAGMPAAVDAGVPPPNTADSKAPAATPAPAQKGKPVGKGG